MGLSRVEEAAVEAAEAMHSSDFGQTLRGYRQQRQSVDYRSELAMYETGGRHAPIIRTLSIMTVSSLIGQPIKFVDEAEEKYFLWVGDAMDALNRIGTYLWGDVQQEARQLVVDEDDLPQWATGYAIRGRHDDSQQGLARVGFSSAAIQAIPKLAEAVAATPCFAAATSEARRVPSDRAVREELGTIRERTMAAVQPSKPETLGVAQNRIRGLVTDAYAGSSIAAAQVASSIRALNELVNYLLWTLTSAAESTVPLPTFGAEVGSVRVAHSHRRMVVRFVTLGHALWVNPPQPLTLSFGSPIDGIYVTRGIRMQGGTEWLHDVEARSLRELELAPAN